MRISSTEEAYIHMFPESRRVLEILTQMAASLRKDVEEGRTLDEEFPVFLLQVAYQGALTTLEMGQGNLNDQLKERLETLKWLLEYIQPRWRVVGKFADQSLWVLDSNIAMQGYIYPFYSRKR